MVLLLFVALLLPGLQSPALTSQNTTPQAAAAGTQQAAQGAKPVPAAVSRGIVLRPVVNMFSKATEDSDVVSQAIYGSHLNVVEDQGEWIRVNTPDDYFGWMRAGAVKRIGEVDHTYASNGRVGQVISMFCHLYREADVTKHAPALTVPFETRLEIMPAAEGRPEGRWLQARLPDERTLWVQSGDLMFEAKPITIPATIALAKRFLGLPYTWGGTSSYGYDCSGFTQMLVKMRGVIMPRDAGPQAHWIGMEKLTREQLQPGDLLYFGSSEQRITHTAMYIGNDEFIHATTHDRPVIQISRLSDEYWTKLLVAMRRVRMSPGL